MATASSLPDEFASSTVNNEKKDVDRFSLVWLDKQENILVHLQNTLRECLQPLKIFNDAQNCVHWIRFRPMREIVIVIISDIFVNEVLLHIGNLTGIVLYIHCSTASEEDIEAWKKTYERKVSALSQKHRRTHAKVHQVKDVKTRIFHTLDLLHHFRLRWTGCSVHRWPWAPTEIRRANRKCKVCRCVDFISIFMDWWKLVLHSWRRFPLVSAFH